MASQHITTNFFDCRYVWMISPHIPTTCQPALLAEVLTWVPLPPASTIKDKTQGYSLSEPAGSVSLEQTVTRTNRPLWACFLPI